MCPNGISRTEEGLKQLARHFSLIGPIIESVAKSKGGLRIDKYDRGDASWTLGFARTCGGVATITIGLDERTHADFHVTGIWWVDEYDTETRHSKYTVIGQYRIDEPLSNFSQLLEKALQTITGWTVEVLDRHDGAMDNWKRVWKTREAFEQAERRNYPLLDI